MGKKGQENYCHGESIPLPLQRESGRDLMEHVPPGYFENAERAHSPLLSAGLASVSK